jgi:hypothetical protein
VLGLGVDDVFNFNMVLFPYRNWVLVDATRVHFLVRTVCFECDVSNPVAEEECLVSAANI